MTDVFFSLRHFYMLTAKDYFKQIFNFDEKNKNNKNAICTFFTHWPTLLLFCFFSASLITLTTKCKTNLILDKTNKINSLQ